MKNNLPKLVVTDIDGVWTDGGMYYDNTDLEFKKFNTKDSTGVFYLKKLNISIAIVTGENTQIVERRAKKLNINHLYMGVKNKLKVVEELCKSLDVRLCEVAYIGDEINDYEIIQKVGISGCPSDANELIKPLVSYLLEKKGGEGAFLEFVEKIIGLENCLNIIQNNLNLGSVDN